MTPTLKCVDANYDGSFTAHLGYINENADSVAIAIGPDNKFAPGDENRGQPTTFQSGTFEEVFTTSWDGSNLVWTVVYGSNVRSVGMSKDSPRCGLPPKPITPVADCIDYNGDGGYVAHFGYINGNSLAVTIPAGTDNASFANAFSPAPGTRGQPDTFQPGTHTGSDPLAFTVAFDGEDLTWSIQNDGTGVQSATINRNTKLCNPQPVQPRAECVFKNSDETFTAFFGYENQNGFPVDIPVGSDNAFWPTPEDRGQPSNFAVGTHKGVFSVTSEGSSLTWKINFQGISRAATASSETPECVPLTPITECIDDDRDGTCTAHFGYQNGNEFSVPVPVGDTNKFTPDPKDRGQPGVFDAGRHVNEFSVSFACSEDAPGNLTWLLDKNFTTANYFSELCTPNQPPSCSAGSEPYTQACEGTSTTVELSANGSSDPEGHELSYSWSTTCANATFSDIHSVNPVLILTDPGLGLAVDCSVSVVVSDGRDSQSCGQPIHVDACPLDCEGTPFGNQQVDRCGVCGGNDACLDCAGVPFGTATIDQCGVCGGTNTCLDCQGTPNGSAKVDRCGLCQGDGQSCLGCKDIELTPMLFALDGNAFEQRGLVIKTINALKKIGLPLRARDVAKIRLDATTLYTQAWTAIWQIDQKQRVCSNQEFCVSVSNLSSLQTFSGNSESLRGLVDKAVKVGSKGRKLSKSQKRRIRNLLTTADKLQSKGKLLASSVPVEQSRCR